jgi:hypothetical protein
MPTPVLTQRKLAVVDDDGQHLFWVSDAEAHVLISKQQVHYHVKNGVIQKLTASPDLMIALSTGAALDSLGEPVDVSIGRGSGLDHTRYSTRQGTEDTPENVWTLKHLRPSTQSMYFSVQSACLVPWFDPLDEVILLEAA